MRKINAQHTFLQDMWAYAMQIRQFSSQDWGVYAMWVGLMLGLLGSTTGFVWFMHVQNISFPSYVWNVPIGTFIFVVAIAFDTIGHRTAYKQELAKGEALVHHITIFAGITSCLLLCLAYKYPVFLKIPTLTFVGLSIIYSLIDEALHWHRYLRGISDRVEMWSHFFIFLGHFIFILSWSKWYLDGYPGVREALQALR